MTYDIEETPIEIQDAFYNLLGDKDSLDYDEIRTLKYSFEKETGWSFSYGLDSMPYEFYKINH